LEIRPETGRSHQIRVQLAAAGHPIVGDRKYGSRQPFADGIALRAVRLRFEHPVKKTPVTVEIEPNLLPAR
jgi:23S rRNA pseudouridine1911/1915/1917 synthase